MEFNTAEKGASAGDNAKSVDMVSPTITDILYSLKPVTIKKENPEILPVVLTDIIPTEACFIFAYATM